MSDLSTLSVDRLHNRYLVPRDHPQPEAVRRQFDAVVRRHLGEALALALQKIPLDQPEEAVWFIRRLEIDLALDASASLAALATRWSQHLAAALHHELQRPSANDVRYYPDRAAYVANFVKDLAAGRAWEQWYYAPFAGLRSLLPHQAIREAIMREAEAAPGYWRAYGRKGIWSKCWRRLPSATGNDYMPLVVSQPHLRQRACFSMR